MATVGDVASTLGVGAQTVRDWCDEFKEFLSPTATPPKGHVRTFSQEDLSVLALVARMRSDLAGYDLIKEALANGERGQVVSADEEAGPSSTALALRYERELARWQGELTATKEERDYLREQLKEETGRPPDSP